MVRKLKHEAKGRYSYLTSWLEMRNKSDKHDQPSRTTELSHKLGLLLRRRNGGHNIEENCLVIFD